MIRPALCAAALFAIVAGVARAETVNRIIATVDGEPITSYELQKFMNQPTRSKFKEIYDQQPSAVLEAYITEKIIEKEVSEKGLVVKDEDIDRYIAGIAAQNRMNPDQLKAAVENQGLSWDSYRTEVRHEVEKAQLINREIKGKVNVTPEEVERYYEAHKEEYATPEGLHVRHIFLRLPPDAPADEVDRVMARARDLRKKVVGGADFAEVAKENSEDPAASSGGDLGFVKKGEILEELDAAAEKLKVGEISEPVRSSVGVHIIKVEERQGESHTPLPQMADEIKQRLYTAALEERYERWLLEDLRQRHHVEIRP